MMRHDRVTLHHGDCLEVLRTLPDASVDSVVTDPPYGLGFMGKEWDSGKSFVERKPAKRNTFDHVGGNHNPTSSADAARTRRSESRKFGEWCELWAAECLRVLKPGGHLLAFGGTRTWHRLACAVEDAGFEVRDSIAWLYGSGFPKSLDVSKAIDKAAGAEREVIRERYTVKRIKPGATVVAEGEWGKQDVPYTATDTAPATPDAETWQGWGTALKPAFEPVVVARKPLVGTVAGNVLAHGTGALNIDACRIGDGGQLKWATPRGMGSPDSFADDAWTQAQGRPYAEATASTSGRWPANVVLDESQADALDQQSGIQRDGVAGARSRGFRKEYVGGRDVADAGLPAAGYGGEGGASRFFYVAKAPKRERPRTDDGTAHPTVKPLALMRWLVRLVTPPGGVVLEPFAGSGTTVEACILEGFRCVAIEREADYLPLIEARIARQLDAKEQAEPDLFDLLGEATA